MRNKIEKLLPRDKHAIKTISYKTIYVADWTNYNPTRGVAIHGDKPSISTITISNNRRLDVIFDGFAQHALPIKKGLYNKQCECVLFSTSRTSDHWILFIETKYAKDRKLAFRKESDYPAKMVSQIIETVQYFRDKEIISKERLVHALVAFPNLDEDYNDVLFTLLQEKKPDMSIEHIRLKYNIMIRGNNYANIISKKQIRLSSNH